MELPDPHQIELDGVTLELIKDAEELARQVNEIRPLSGEVLEQIQKRLLGDRVYNSNAIEGNRLTLRETIQVLEAGAVVDVGRKRDAVEALNLEKAIAKVQAMVDDRKQWSNLSTFLDVHATLMEGVDDCAGTLRNASVMIRGAKYQPPGEGQVRPLLDQFFEFLAEATEVAPIVLATWTHWTIARIHPFLDGNGRMARLWQDLVLFGGGYTAAVIPVTDRNEYYGTLTAADAGDFKPMTRLIARCVISGLNLYLHAAREVDELQGWALEIVGETQARLEQQLELEYIRWKRAMEEVRDAFQRCATQITGASDGSVSVRLEPLPIIDQAAWENLRAGERTPRTWFFWLHFRRGETRIQYCFFFGRHPLSPADNTISGLGPAPCLLISEQQGYESAQRLDTLEGVPLSLRELILIDGRLARRRVDDATGNDTYDRDISPLTVAKEFITEVLLRRLR